MTPASAECDDGGPVLALNRTSDEFMGLVEVIVAARDGDVELVTGDWVATKPRFSPDGRSLVTAARSRSFARHLDRHGQPRTGPTPAGGRGVDQLGCRCGAVIAG